MKVRLNNGFTLIEVLIVIAILGIVFAIATPNYNKYRQNTNLKEAARDISSDISYYKQRAIAENRDYRIDFNAAANTYTIRQETAPNTGIYSDLSTKKVGTGYSSIVISGTPNFAGNTYVTFNPRGTSTAGSLVLTHNVRTSTATITINLMGRVNVQYLLK